MQSPRRQSDNQRCWWCDEFTPEGVCTRPHPTFNYREARMSGNVLWAPGDRKSLEPRVLELPQKSGKGSTSLSENGDTLTIVLLTYNRLPYALRTLGSLLDNLEYTLGPVRLHIADDGSPDESYVPTLVREAVDACGFSPRSITVSNAQRGGYGKSYNMATMHTHFQSDFMLVMEDDWECQRRFNADPIVAALKEDQALADAGSPDALAAVRLGLIGYTAELRGRFRYLAHHQYLMLDPESPERHVNSGHPRIETVAYQRRVGPWAEGLGAGATEFEWCGRAESRKGVAWPIGMFHLGELFAHIGTITARED